MTLDLQMRQELIKLRIENAWRTKADARYALDGNRLHMAVNRIYYAMFHMVSAPALKHKFETGKHMQLIGWFNKTFIKTGKLDKRFSTILQEGYNRRAEGDYDDRIVFITADVEKSYADMLEFLNEIEKLIKD